MEKFQFDPPPPPREESYSTKTFHAQRHAYTYTSLNACISKRMNVILFCSNGLASKHANMQAYLLANMKDIFISSVQPRMESGSYLP